MFNQIESLKSSFIIDTACCSLSRTFGTIYQLSLRPLDLFNAENFARFKKRGVDAAQFWQTQTLLLLKKYCKIFSSVRVNYMPHLLI